MVAHSSSFPVSEKYLRTKRKAIESLYCGTMTVTNTDMVRNEKTHISEPKETVVYEDIPCRLSFQQSRVTTENEPAKGEIETRVMCAPEIEIKDGSYLTITQHDKTATYRRSGIPRHYSDHQTIPLVLVKYS